jgi:hypothetical protein
MKLKDMQTLRNQFFMLLGKLDEDPEKLQTGD